MATQVITQSLSSSTSWSLGKATPIQSPTSPTPEVNQQPINSLRQTSMEGDINVGNGGSLGAKITDIANTDIGQSIEINGIAYVPRSLLYEDPIPSWILDRIRGDVPSEPDQYDGGEYNPAAMINDAPPKMAGCVTKDCGAVAVQRGPVSATVTTAETSGVASEFEGGNIDGSRPLECDYASEPVHIITGDNKSCYLHRNLLERAPGLKELCANATSQSQLLSIRISAYNQRHFKHLVHWLYTGVLAKDLSNEELCMLYRMAIEYNITAIKLDLLKEFTIDGPVTYFMTIIFIIYRHLTDNNDPIRDFIQTKMVQMIKTSHLHFRTSTWNTVLEREMKEMLTRTAQSGGLLAADVMQALYDAHVGTLDTKLEEDRNNAGTKDEWRIACHNDEDDEYDGEENVDLRNENENSYIEKECLMPVKAYVEDGDVDSEEYQDWGRGDTNPEVNDNDDWEDAWPKVKRGSWAPNSPIPTASGWANAKIVPSVTTTTDDNIAPQTMIGVNDYPTSTCGPGLYPAPALMLNQATYRTSAFEPSGTSGSTGLRSLLNAFPPQYRQGPSGFHGAYRGMPLGSYQAIPPEAFAPSQPGAPHTRALKTSTTKASLLQQFAIQRLILVPKVVGEYNQAEPSREFQWFRLSLSA